MLELLRLHVTPPIVSPGDNLALADGCIMYRVIAIVGGGLTLAACSSTNLDFLKPTPAMSTVQFESEPPGAEAKVSNGQTCRTPCALALPSNESYTVSFTLNGYQPAAENIEPQSLGDNTVQLGPNPVLVQLEPAAPPPKKPVRRHKPAAAKKPPRPAAAAPPPPPAAPAAPAAPQAQPASPWPPAQPQPAR